MQKYKKKKKNQGWGLRAVMEMFSVWAITLILNGDFLFKGDAANDDDTNDDCDNNSNKDNSTGDRSEKKWS